MFRQLLLISGLLWVGLVPSSGPSENTNEANAYNITVTRGWIDGAYRVDPSSVAFPIALTPEEANRIGRPTQSYLYFMLNSYYYIYAHINALPPNKMSPILRPYCTVIPDKDMEAKITDKLEWSYKYQAQIELQSIQRIEADPAKYIPVYYNNALKILPRLILTLDEDLKNAIQTSPDTDYTKQPELEKQYKAWLPEVDPMPISKQIEAYQKYSQYRLSQRIFDNQERCLQDIKTLIEKIDKLSPVLAKDANNVQLLNHLFRSTKDNEYKQRKQTFEQYFWSLRSNIALIPISDNGTPTGINWERIKPKINAIEAYCQKVYSSKATAPIPLAEPQSGPYVTMPAPDKPRTDVQPQTYAECYMAGCILKQNFNKKVKEFKEACENTQKEWEKCKKDLKAEQEKLQIQIEEVDEAYKKRLKELYTSPLDQKQPNDGKQVPITINKQDYDKAKDEPLKLQNEQLENLAYQKQELGLDRIKLPCLVFRAQKTEQKTG